MKAHKSSHEARMKMGKIYLHVLLMLDVVSYDDVALCCSVAMAVEAAVGLQPCHWRQRLG